MDREKAEKLTKKLKKGKGFDLEDFRDQLQQMKNMGGLGGLMDKLPSMGGINLAQMGNAQGAAEKQFKQMEAIINSMTPAERGIRTSSAARASVALPWVPAPRCRTLVA